MAVAVGEEEGVGEEEVAAVEVAVVVVVDLQVDTSSLSSKAIEALFSDDEWLLRA